MWRWKILPSSLTLPPCDIKRSLKSKWKFPPPEYENVSIVCTNISSNYRHRFSKCSPLFSKCVCLSRVKLSKQNVLVTRPIHNSDGIANFQFSTYDDDDDLMKLIEFDWLWRTCLNIIVGFVLVMLLFVLNSVIVSTQFPSSCERIKSSAKCFQFFTEKLLHHFRDSKDYAFQPNSRSKKILAAAWWIPWLLLMPFHKHAWYKNFFVSLPLTPSKRQLISVN